MKKERKKTHRICNFLLFLSFISVVANFIIIILFQKNSNLMIEIISSLLLCLFIIFYTFSQITNHRNNKSTVVIASLFILGYSLFQISIKLDLVNMLKLNHVEDFRNQSLVEVIKWSEKNKIKVNQIYEYSDTVDEYNIIGQNIKENTLTKDVKELTVVVSEGPNPDKEVILPNMETWDGDKVVNFIKSNFLSNTNIEFITSDKEKNTLIEQSKSGTIKRNDELKLTFSLGDEELEDVKLIDLKNKTLFDAEFYLKKNAIKYDIEKKFSSKITRNYIIDTNKEIGTMLKPNDEENKLVLKASKGKKIKVPDLKKYSMLQITKWVIKNKLKLEFTNQYDDSIKPNKVIDINYNKGDSIEEKTLIKVTISKGKLVMLSFDSIEEFKSWANKYNINYEEKFEFSNDIEEGRVISYSHKTGDTIKNDDTIVVTISQGKKTKVPNVIGNTKAEAIKKLEEAKLKYNIVYENSIDAKNKVIKQSLSSGSEVAQNSTITLTLSNGKRPTNSNSSNSSNKNNNQGNNEEADFPKESCDKSKTTTIDLYTGDTGSQTEGMIRSANPGIKFIFEMVSQCSNGSTASGSVCNASSLTSANYCDTYKVIVVK